MDGPGKEEEEAASAFLGEFGSTGGRDGGPSRTPLGLRNWRLQNGKRGVKLEAANMWLL